ncbi:MAG: hypothetical protein PUK14_03445 [Clostridiales bacterium]|nr:hypothetical protein [Clostridiales bacterium]
MKDKMLIILSGLINIIGIITSVIVIKNGYITLGVMILILSVILLILSIYAIYIKYITKIKELENRVYLYEGVINELKNEITELKERK